MDTHNIINYFTQNNCLEINLFFFHIIILVIFIITLQKNNQIVLFILLLSMFLYIIFTNKIYLEPIIVAILGFIVNEIINSTNKNIPIMQYIIQNLWKLPYYGIVGYYILLFGKNKLK
jgi:hypothetical protein